MPSWLKLASWHEFCRREIGRKQKSTWELVQARKIIISEVLKNYCKVIQVSNINNPNIIVRMVIAANINATVTTVGCRW